MSKKIVITGYEEYGDQAHVDASRKNLVAYGPETMDAHDGYHSFTELYEHRIALWIALCKQLVWSSGLDANAVIPVYEIWRSKLHSDGEAFDGWFILGLGKAQGGQITYHVPLDRWDETEFAETLERAPAFDGHSSSHVLDRLKRL